MSEKQITLRKFYTKPVKGTVIDYTETINLGQDEIVNNAHNVTLYQKIHPDLQQAMDRLIPHMVMLVEEKGAYELTLTEHYKYAANLVKDREITDYPFGKYEVLGVTLREGGVLMTGRKRLRNGQSLTIDTSFTHYEQTQHYVNMDALQQDIEDLKGEINRYMNGKFVLSEQLNLAFSAKQDAVEAKPAVEPTAKTETVKEEKPKAKPKVEAAKKDVKQPATEKATKTPVKMPPLTGVTATA
jgi:hypothetical protein